MPFDPGKHPDPQALPHVVILGGGFGGLWAARGLADTPARMTLVDRNNHHLFQPLLYQVATGGLAANNVAAPLRQLLRRQHNIEVRLDEALSIDPASRTVSLRHGRLAYDYLVVATGSLPAYFGHDDWAEHAPGLKTLPDALELRGRVLAALEAAERERDPAQVEAWLNFVVIGGGPTGVELAGALAELAHHTMAGEFRHTDSRRARVHLVEAGDRVLPGLPAALSESTCRRLESLGVTVHLGQAVEHIDERGVTFGGRQLPSGTVLWAAGVAASPLGRDLGARADQAGGRVKVDADLSVPGHPEVFVVGDLAAAKTADGKPVPGVAPAAKQMGTYVAGAIGRRLQGEAPPPFRYRDRGSLATLGRKAAVVHAGPLRLQGRLGWWFWLLAHLFFLVGFRNRFVVVFNGAWSSWTHQRHARLIVWPPRPPR